MKSLIDAMIVSDVLKNDEIIEAFTAVDRKYFVPTSLSEFAYIDVPLSIGNEQTISQPSTVAFMLEKLSVKSGDKVLDIGSGSGWTTALLCHLVGNNGSVTGIERIDTLVEQGRENLLLFNVNQDCHIKKSGGMLGMPEEQFDRILVSAGADELPQELLSQLKIGGILVIPVTDFIYKIKKISEDDFLKEEYFGFRFVPLVY